VCSPCGCREHVLHAVSNGESPEPAPSCPTCPPCERRRCSTSGERTWSRCSRCTGGTTLGPDLIVSMINVASDLVPRPGSTRRYAAFSVEHHGSDAFTLVVLPARFPSNASDHAQTITQRVIAGHNSGQGRDRTADLPLFRRTLIPTELPDLDRRHQDQLLGWPPRPGDRSGPDGI
jgi:hypothetical protein